MAVYTEVDLETLRRFLTDYYDLGDLNAANGISEGIQNTNYALNTNKGRFILTIFEKRTPSQDLPFFMALMEHLASKGISCPRPVINKDGGLLQDLLGKKVAIVSFVQGKPVMLPSPDNCRTCGKLLAQMHLASSDFPKNRHNPLDLDGLKAIFKHIQGKADKKWPGLEEKIKIELSFLQGAGETGLPSGIIHADLFPDNVHFEEGRISGIIDFYFACTDAFSFDIAVTANSWCFGKTGQFESENFVALLRGYESVRPLNQKEKAALPSLMRRAALRFLLTRAQDWLFPPEGIMGTTKDPVEYMKILSFHRERRHIDDYLD